jgi:glycosyltransferase involved in cell wall biosynthesis
MDSIPRQICGSVTSGTQLAREFGNVFPGRYIMCSSHVLGEIRIGEVELGERIVMLPNWVDGARPPARNEFFEGGHLRILHVAGTLSEPKGTQILIEAAAVLRDSGLGNFTIDIYGREDDWRFRRALHKLGVADVVRLMGSRSHDELVSLYRRYDLLAFPTWSREPFGFVALEAAAAGCVPLITADCGAAEWLIDGVDCLKAPRNAYGFAKRISEILHGELDLADLGRRGQAVVWREFHISRVVGEVERLLAEAASERRPARGGVGEFFTLATFGGGLIHALMSEANA